MRKITLIIIILAAIAGIAGLYYYQKNVYSKEILKLEILGPEEADLLQEIEYIIKYKNNGNIRLDEPELIFEYPQYSIVEKEQPLRVQLSAKDLGEAIYPGEEKTFHFKARLLGKEGETKTAKATLTFNPKNLKARYERTTTLTTIIKKVPLTFEFDLPSQIESGKEFRFRLNYFSNIDYPISNLRIVADYPSGFEFVESAPKSLEKTEWELGLLNKAKGGRVEILGRLSGEVGEEKIFGAKLGSWQEGEFVLLKEVNKGIEIIKPSLYVLQQINNNPQYIASPGDWLHYEIFFKNVGDTDLNNLFLVCKLEGETFDFQTIKSDLGNYESGDNSIIFDWRKVSKLQYLPPMEEGKVEFWINLKEEFGISRNPVIKNKVFISQVQEEFVTKVNSKLVVTQRGYFQDEIFGNEGPLPPRVGGATTYTIGWQVKNYYNEVKDVKVKATLPQNVSLTGKIFPEEASQKFAFDSQSREIVWTVGDLDVGSGVVTSAPNISFQISLTPTESQKGQTPLLISGAKITGQDQWTRENLESSSPGINTTLPDDETVSEQQGIVQ